MDRPGFFFREGNELAPDVTISATQRKTQYGCNWGPEGKARALQDEQGWLCRKEK